MVSYKIYFSTVIAFLIVIWFLLQKEKETVIVDVVIPPIEGKFDTIYVPKPITIVERDPLNEDLYDKYLKAKDSLERLQMYLDAISIKEYKEVYEDSTITITTYSKTRGDLLEQTNEYYIKPRVIPTEINVEKVNQLYGIIEGGISVDLKPTISAGLILKNKKDNLLSLKINSNKEVLVGYGYKF